MQGLEIAIGLLLATSVGRREDTAESIEIVGPRSLLFRERNRAAEEVRSKRTRLHDDDRDAEWRDFLSQGFRNAFDRKLGRVVMS